MKNLVLILALAGCGDDTPAGPYAYRDPSGGKIRLVRSGTLTTATPQAVVESGEYRAELHDVARKLLQEILGQILG